MADFDFLSKYLVPNEQHSNAEPFNSYKHKFFPVKTEVINEVLQLIKIPKELNHLYKSIGYGFLHAQNTNQINRLFDPYSFKQINLREEYYKFDPDIDLYNDESYLGKLIFFELNDGVYLMIEKNDTNGKNPIYYFDRKIAESLEEFLKKMDEIPNYFEK